MTRYSAAKEVTKLNYLSKETYEANGETYELTTGFDNDRYQIIVTHNGKEFGPRYGVDIASDVNYFMTHEERLLDNLKRIIMSDLDVGMYLKK